ncbi:uncharacterized protein LOC117603669 isoform X1 [Osmia lignaria lignaria]|uniref:uncharacterized protein LOC117603669 isoform X1 n=1 Tax=Osmia lignaria lignaria TaxID=1437193 RepID=UPI0014781D7E|nr:uncharacterized protein LOC117603669 isoform X1 [Osmia lignaria]
MIGKLVTKFIQSLPSWEVTKYYGRVCIYQLKCLKYKVQTSEAWFNFKCKFMPGSLQNELECEEPKQNKVKDKKQQVKHKLPADAEAYKKKQYQLQYPKDKEDEFEDTSCNDIKDNYMQKKNQKYESAKHQEKEDYNARDDYRTKKQRKVKRAQ